MSTISKAASAATPSHCVLCKQAVTALPLDFVLACLDLTSMEVRVIDAISEGGGLPVKSDAIFTEMYFDDPNGGPTPNRMYHALSNALYGLRKKLKGTGYAVEDVGFRAGYRIAVENEK